MNMGPLFTWNWGRIQKVLMNFGDFWEVCVFILFTCEAPLNGGRLSPQVLAGKPEKFLEAVFCRLFLYKKKELWGSLASFWEASEQQAPATPPCRADFMWFCHLCGGGLGCEWISFAWVVMTGQVVMVGILSIVDDFIDFLLNIYWLVWIKWFKILNQ